MPTLATNALTLADWAKRRDPDDRVATIVELLNQSNEILQDMLWMEGNLPTGHRTTVRTGLPEVAWRKLNYGVPQSKSTTVQVDDTTGMLEAFGQVDKDLAELNGNTAQFRLSENMAFLEAMNQKMAQTLIYGNSGTEPEAFTGLAPRYATISGAANGQNILSAGGTSGNTSVWLVGWGDNTVHGIYPKGSTAGLQHTDLGLDTITDAAGGKYRAYQDHYQWKCGVSLRDWRYVTRIANVNITDLTALATTQAGTAATELIKMMSRSIDRIPSFGMCKPVFYMNRTVFSMLRVMALQKSNAALSIEQALDQFGNPISGNMSFMGIPIRRVDAILNNEAQIS
jgi:hypothetical protein